MKLWYINIWLKPETGYDDNFRYEFTLHTRFISNYFSKQMRRKRNRFETDGTFRMISVNPTPLKLEKCKIVPETALSVDIPFDREIYERIKGTSDVEYYLELLQEGFIKASKYKKVPLEMLLRLIDDFRNKGYKNEWQHIKKRFDEQDIEVVLNCYFTTFDFKLNATINKISTGEKLCSGIILKTEPDEICFGKEFKDILIGKDNIIITDAFDSPNFSINLKDAFNKEFSFKLRGNKKVIEFLA